MKLKDDDIVLLKRIKDDDYTAFEQLFNKYYDLLCNFSFQLLGDRGASEEIADDVFLRLWQHRHEGDITSIRAYMLQAVRNGSLNALRSAPEAKSLHFLNISNAEAARYIDSLFTDSQHPLGHLIEKEMDHELARAIDALPEQTRRVFLLSRNGEKTHEEIAHALGISKTTVNYHMQKATKMLSFHMSKYLLWLLLLIMQNIK